jgi:hypothetical protein
MRAFQECDVLPVQVERLLRCQREIKEQPLRLVIALRVVVVDDDVQVIVIVFRGSASVRASVREGPFRLRGEAAHGQGDE